MGALASLKTVFTALVGNGGTVTVPYPAGTTQAQLQGSTGSQLLIGEAAVYRQSQGHFEIAFNANDITLTNRSGEPWIAGRAVLTLARVARRGSYNLVLGGEYNTAKPADGSVSPPTGPATYQFVILTGQSDMVGIYDAQGGTNGALDPALDTTDPRILQYANSGPNAGKLVLAQDPLANTGPGGGIGPGMSFARNLLKTLGPNDKIVLIPCAVGGTALVTGDAEWSATKPGTAYSKAIDSMSKALALVPSGSIIADPICVNSQGGNDPTATIVVYRNAQGDLVAGIRAVPGFERTRFVSLAMGPERMGDGTQNIAFLGIAHAQLTLTERIARAVFVDRPIGFATPGDVVHSTAEGNRIAGARSAAAVPIAAARAAAPGVYGRHFLDRLSGVAPATFAVGLRKLRMAATRGVLLRRSGDNAEMEFGFTPHGDIDLDTYSVWASQASGDCRAMRLFDQVGAADLVTNTDYATALAIMRSTQPEILGLRPTLRAADGNRSMWTDAFNPPATGWLATIFDPTEAGTLVNVLASPNIVIENNGSKNVWAIRPRATALDTAVTIPDGANFVYAEYSPAGTDIWVNGVLASKSALAANSGVLADGLCVGGRKTSAGVYQRGFKGRISELVMGSGTPTAADRAIILDAYAGYVRNRG